MRATAKICVFDVNETLLNLAPIDRLFATWFRTPTVMREWFGQLVLYSQSLTLSGRYIDFGELAAAMLEMVARTHSQILPRDAGQTLKSTILNLPPHHDVKPSLTKLRNAGVRLVTLTNSNGEAQRRQLHNAEIAELFEAQFSVERVRAFKPARATYDSVAAALNADPAHMILVACHAWDVIGAQAAGYQTGFVGRVGNAQLSVIETQATYAGDDLVELVDVILADQASAS